MYIAFLTLRYLSRKAIVIFPILVVWLCVMMMIIVTSIMGGFVDRVLQANRELLGDVIIETSSSAGFPYYEEMQKDLETLQAPEGKGQLVLAGTPMVRSYGLINLPDYRFNAPAQVIGIDPVGRAAVSGAFRKSLYRQYTAPEQAVEDLSEGKLPASGEELRARAQGKYDELDKKMEDVWKELYGTGVSGSRKTRLEDKRDDLAFLIQRAQATRRLAGTLPAAKTFASAAELREVLVPKEPTFAVPPEVLRNSEATNPQDVPEGGCIVGIDLGLYHRDRQGNYLRPQFLEYCKAVLTVVPVSKKGSMLKPYDKTFVVVDDSYSRVFDVDSTYVYAPFQMVQEMNSMQRWTDVDGKVHPGRANEIHLKVRDADDPIKLHAACDAINKRIAQFAERHTDLDLNLPTAQTWDQKQAKYIGAVRNEKSMMTVILGIMSLVVVVVIFLIFYIIVRDKTRDIGIIKAVGGSEEGVMGIFVMYGLFIGLVGGLLGTISGVEFVWHTNFIHDRILHDIFGWTIWNRAVYLFDRIPDTVNWWEVGLYFAAAIVSGVLGAAIPALVAGLQNPVRAVRYE